MTVYLPFKKWSIFCFQALRAASVTLLTSLLLSTQALTTPNPMTTSLMPDQIIPKSPQSIIGNNEPIITVMNPLLPIIDLEDT